MGNSIVGKNNSFFSIKSDKNGDIVIEPDKLSEGK
jgi:hypothetical protein